MFPIVYFNKKVEKVKKFKCVFKIIEKSVRLILVAGILPKEAFFRAIHGGTGWALVLVDKVRRV